MQKACFNCAGRTVVIGSSCRSACDENGCSNLSPMGPFVKAPWQKSPIRLWYDRQAFWRAGCREMVVALAGSAEAQNKTSAGHSRGRFLAWACFNHRDSSAPGASGVAQISLGVRHGGSRAVRVSSQLIGPSREMPLDMARPVSIMRRLPAISGGSCGDGRDL